LQKVYGYALLHNSGGGRDKITLPDRSVLKLTPEILSLIRDNLIDLVVIGAPNDNERYAVFDTLLEVLDNPTDRYNLKKPAPPPAMQPGRSINRCSDTTAPFLPSRFKIGAETPGQMNDCSASTYLIAEADGDIEMVDIEAETLDCAGPSAVILAPNANQVSVGTQTTMTFPRHATCVPLDLRPELAEDEVTQANQFLAAVGAGPAGGQNVTQDWEDTGHFKIQE